MIPSSAQDARHQPTMASDPFARVAFGARDRDFRDRQARLARFLFVGAAIVALGTFPFLPDGVDRVPIVIVGSVGLVVGLLLPALPWHRWPWWALLVPAVLGFVLLATAGRLSPGALEHYLALYSLSFVYIGLVAPPRVPVCFVPLAVLSFAIGDSQHLGDHVVNLATAAPVWALIGEVIANGLADRQEGERRRTAALTVAADTDALTGLANRRLFDRTSRRCVRATPSCSSTSITSSPSTTGMAIRSAMTRCVTSPPRCARSCVRVTARRATAATSSAWCSRARGSQARK